MFHGISCLSLKAFLLEVETETDTEMRRWKTENLFPNMCFIIGQNALLDLLGGMEPGDADAVVQAVTGNQPQQQQQQQVLASTAATPAASNVNADILDLLGKL